MSDVTAPNDGEVRGLDRALLRVYLNDHLAGSVAGLDRMRRTAQTLARTPVGGDLDAVADEIEGEQDELRAIIAGLDMPEALLKQVATWAGEKVARLKGNGRFGRHSPMTPLLEVELLRSAVMGKRGLWQTLTDLAPSIGLDASRPARLLAQTDRQLERLDGVHEYVRVRALQAASGRR